MRASFHASTSDGLSAETGQPPPCSRHPGASNTASRGGGSATHCAAQVLPGITRSRCCSWRWGALLQGATGRMTLSALALARCRRLGVRRRELLQVSPGCGSLVSSPEGRAGSCHCGSLPVGFENCISNFCRYFKKILPKAVYITDTLSLQGMCGMAEALQNAVTVENVSGERKQTPSRWFYLAPCRCVF